MINTDFVFKKKSSFVQSSRILTNLFQEPRVFGIIPSHGPVSGGTRITITGEYLKLESGLSVKIDSYCNITRYGYVNN